MSTAQKLKAKQQREIRAIAEPALHRHVKAAAKAARMSMGNWLLQAAEEKLAGQSVPLLHVRPTPRGNGEAA